MLNELRSPKVWFGGVLVCAVIVIVVIVLGLAAPAL